MRTKIFFTAMAVFVLTVSAIALVGKSLSESSVTSKNVEKSKLLAEVTSNIEYANAKSSIRGNYNINLNKLAKVVISDNYAVSLRGHADSVGLYKSNWVLSDYRAIAIKKFLIKKGVKADRIITTPFGSTVPIASNKTADGRQKNRRVEIELKESSN